MASNQVRDSRSTHTRHGYSKSQMCFFKILRVISSIPPSQQQPHPSPHHDPSHSQSSRSSRGIDVDLNLRLRDNTDFECLPSDSSAIEENKVGEKSVEVEVSRVTSTEETKFEDRIGEDRERKEEELRHGGDAETASFGGKIQRSYNNCLDLLIEAAKLVFEEPSLERELSSSELRTRRRNEGTGILEVNKDAMKKGKQRWMVVDLCNEMHDTSSPVVRSKRGRSQALPFRFRDSVVEPLKRSGRLSTTTGASRKRLVGS